jgi:diphthine-ammonia ligase
MRLGVLFSGGKDSVFALSRAMEKNEVACLITIVSENVDSYMFHTPNIGRTSLQAEALGLPLLSWPTIGEKEEELQDLTAAVAAAKDQFGIDGLVTGAIESVYQSARVQRIARDLDLWCFNPLWQANQVDYLRLLLARGFRVIVTGVFAYPFDASLLGAELTEDLVVRLAELQRRYKINPSGEGGELETFVANGPIFQKRIEILRSSQRYADYRGLFVIEEMRLVER